MSATESVTAIIGTKLARLTYRESKIVTALIDGKCEAQAFRDAGFSQFYQEHPKLFRNWDLIQSEVTRLTDKLVQHGIDEWLVDAEEIHEQLTAQMRGDLAELYNPLDPLDSRYNPAYSAGDLLPVPLWPLWARQGGVEVLDEPNMVHSDDDGGGSWDQKGRRIKIRVTHAGKAKIAELAMKHKAVNAMVEAKSGDINVTVIHAQVTAKLQGALARKSKLDEARNVTDGKK